MELIDMSLPLIMINYISSGLVLALSFVTDGDN
jgi:hypothetical protein